MPQPIPMLIHSTITDHLKKVEDTRMRRRTFWAMLKQKGAFKYNCSGTDTEWRIKYKHGGTRGYSDMSEVSYVVRDKYAVASNGWRAFIATEAMTAMQKMINKGPNAIIKHFEGIMPDLEKALSDEISRQFFSDGDASGDDEIWQGVKTFLTFDTPAASDRIATPNGSYGGLDTDLGTKGGTWTSDLGSGNYPNATLAKDWPYGQGDYEYDYNSPKGVNWSSTAWGTGGTTWRDNGEYAMREAITWCGVSGGADGEIDMFLSTAKMHNEYKNAQSAKQQINVQPTTSPLWAMGFRDVMNIDGKDYTHDYDVPANECHGLNLDEVEVRSLNEQLFWTQKPWYDARTLSDLFLMGAFGNFRFRKPKGFCLLKNFA